MFKFSLSVCLFLCVWFLYLWQEIAPQPDRPQVINSNKVAKACKKARSSHGKYPIYRDLENVWMERNGERIKIL
jgi:hypothetical protein